MGGKRGRRAALTGVAAIGLNSAVVNLPMKIASKRRRPDREIAGVPEARWVTMPTSTSFPSGHSASAFAFAGAVAGELPVLAVPLRALAAGVAYSRVHTGVHYPGDVIVGSLVGATIGEAAALTARAVHRRRAARRTGEPPTRLERCCLGGMPLRSGRHGGGGRGGTAGGLPTMGAGRPDAPDLSAFVVPIRSRVRCSCWPRSWCRRAWPMRELAGLPAVTGLYTTIACLIGYALFGPSRILVLGPDSSVAPLIFAAIVPLLVTGDPAEAVALAGMMALLVGAIEVGLGLGKLGFVADLLSKEVQVGYMNGLAITILVGQLPKLFGFSTDADGFIAGMQGVRAGARREERHGARDRDRDVGGSADPASRIAASARCVGRGRRRDDRHGRARPRSEGGRHGRRPATRVAGTDVPVGAARHDGSAVGGGPRHRARLPHRHDRHIDQLRRASWR